MCLVSSFFFTEKLQKLRSTEEIRAEEMSTKRPRGSPTGQTPVQTSKRSSRLRGYSSAVAKRNLSREFAPEAGVSNVAVPHTAWSVEEVTLLLSFIAKQGKLRWPAASDLDFWKQASLYLRENGKERTGIL